MTRPPEDVPPGQASIFDPVDAPVRRLPLPPATPAGEPALWKQLDKSTRHRCDECVRLQGEDPAAPVARAARYRRVEAGRDYDWLLCEGHARPWRDRDAAATGTP